VQTGDLERQRQIRRDGGEGLIDLSQVAVVRRHAA
jgi:hypothetical protein